MIDLLTKELSCTDISIHWCDINRVTISYRCHLRKVVARKKNFIYILLAQHIYVTCAFKSNLNINPEAQLLPCTNSMPLVTNSMHLQTTYNLHLQYLQWEVHLESSQTSVVELFRGNSQRVKEVGYFRRRAPSWMFDRLFDRILNAILLPDNLL